MEKEFNGYDLSRDWFNFCFDNPELIKPIHSAIYFFAIEHCNRLGWKSKFGFPSQMVMESIGIKNWRTYSKALNELVDFGFIEMIEISKNQYSSNIIAIAKNTKAQSKALDKALQKHSQKHSQSTVSINKQETIKQGTINIPDFESFKNYALEKSKTINVESLKLKYDSWIENNWKDGNGNKIKNWKSKLLNTIPYLKHDEQRQKPKMPL